MRWRSSQLAHFGGGSYRLRAFDAQPRKDRPDGASIAAVSDSLNRQDLGGMPHPPCVPLVSVRGATHCRLSR